MAINFTTNIEQYTTASTTQRTSSFYNYTSKKQLQSANILSTEALNFVLSIKNTFAFAVHKNLQYVAVTLYYANTKQYAFIVLDLHNKAVAQATSIRHAKQEIFELVAQQEANA